MLDTTQLNYTRTYLKMARKATEKLKEIREKSTGKSSKSSKATPQKPVDSAEITNLANANYSSLTHTQKNLDNGRLDGSNLSPESIKPFEVDKYRVTDPLKPQETDLKQTDSERETAKRIYAERANAQASYIDYYKDAGRMYQIQGAEADAIKDGINAARKQETAQGAFIDYRKTQEDNKQKYIDYRLAEYKTGNAIAKAPYTAKSLDSELEKLQHESAKKSLESEKALTDLDNFRKRLNGDTQPIK